MHTATISFGSKKKHYKKDNDGFSWWYEDLPRHDTFADDLAPHLPMFDPQPLTNFSR